MSKLMLPLPKVGVLTSGALLMQPWTGLQSSVKSRLMFRSSSTLTDCGLQLVSSGATVTVYCLFAGSAWLNAPVVVSGWLILLEIKVIFARAGWPAFSTLPLIVYVLDCGLPPAQSWTQLCVPVLLMNV